MDNHNFNKLKESENSLKIDKDLIEVQKTIIFYGENIIFRLNKIMELLDSTCPNRKDKEKISRLQDPLIQLLQNMKIPKGKRLT